VSCTTTDCYLEAFLARQALQPSWQHLTRWSSMLDCHHRVIRPDCGGVPRPNQQGCSSVLEQIGQAIGGDDRGCSSIFVFIPTDFHCGETFQFGFAA